MTQIAGTDEAMHPTGEDRAWSESYYFNFVEPKTGVGMFTRMGFRPGNGWADALHAVYLGGSRVAFTYGRRDIGKDLSAYDGDLKVGNLALSCEGPFRRWTVRYDGPAQDIPDGAILMTRAKLRPDGWHTLAHLSMEVDVEALTEPHYAARGAHGHFEQSLRATGRLEIGGETLAFDDAALGPRRAVAGTAFGDFLVWRKDDTPSYQLATAVDDLDLGITEVVRGADLVQSTFRQLLLFRALGQPPPAFCHAPLLLDAAGQRLAKRTDALALRTLRAQGVTPAALLADFRRTFPVAP